MYFSNSNIGNSFYNHKRTGYECDNIAFEPGVEDGDRYENLPVTPKNGDPFSWEEDAIALLNKELKRSDDW